MSDGNRIDSRQRGNAHQLHEKYKALARDAQMQGDRVQTEYYLQFADHYFRLLAEQRGRQEDTRPRQRDNNMREDEFESDGEEGGDRPDLAGLPGPARVNVDGNAMAAVDGGDATARADRDDEAEMEDRGGQRRARAPRREPRSRPDNDASVDAAPAGESRDAEDSEIAAPARRAPVRRARKAEAAEQADAPAAAELFPESEAPEAPRRRGRPRRSAETASADA